MRYAVVASKTSIAESYKAFSFLVSLVKNELLDIIEQCKTRNQALEKIEKFLRSYFDSSYTDRFEFAIDKERKIIFLERALFINEKRFTDGEEIHTLGWDCAELEIHVLGKRSRLLTEFKRIVRKIRKKGKYELTIKIGNRYKNFLSYVFDDFSFDSENEIKKMLLGKEVREYFQRLIELIQKLDDRYFGFADGINKGYLRVNKRYEDCVYDFDRQLGLIKNDKIVEWLGASWNFTSDGNELKIKLSDSYIVLRKLEN